MAHPNFRIPSSMPHLPVTLLSRATWSKFVRMLEPKAHTINPNQIRIINTIIDPHPFYLLYGTFVGRYEGTVQKVRVLSLLMSIVIHPIQQINEKNIRLLSTITRLRTKPRVVALSMFAHQSPSIRNRKPN